MVLVGYFEDLSSNITSTKTFLVLTRTVGKNTTTDELLNDEEDVLYKWLTIL